MKKIIAMILALVLVMGLAACGTPAKTKEEVPASALEILEKIWGSYAEGEKFFAMGGDYTNPVDNAPGVFSLAEPENVTAMLLVPAEQQSNIDSAASLTHAMLANNFTAAAFHVTGDAAAFADAMHTAVTGNQWMCGMPEKLTIAIIGGEYVVVAFGINDAMTGFDAKLTAAYSGANMKYSEAITG